jgi:glycyl-tRNA synthetase beta subunit
VNEHVFAAIILLDEAKALGSVEKLDDARAFANDLGRHSAATTASARAAEAATTAAATRAAAEAAAITAAETTAVTTAEAAATTATAETITAAKTVAAARERIKSFFAETVPLVTATTATPSIKTHKPERTFVSP